MKNVLLTFIAADGLLRLVRCRLLCVTQSCIAITFKPSLILGR